MCVSTLVPRVPSYPLAPCTLHPLFFFLSSLTHFSQNSPSTSICFLRYREDSRIVQQAVCRLLPNPALDGTITSSLAVEAVDRGRRCVFLLFGIQSFAPFAVVVELLTYTPFCGLCGPTETCCNVWQESRCDRERWCARWVLRQSWYVVFVVLYLLNVIVTRTCSVGCVPKKVLQHSPRDNTLYR